MRGADFADLREVELDENPEPLVTESADVSVPSESPSDAVRDGVAVRELRRSDRPSNPPIRYGNPTSN